MKTTQITIVTMVLILAGLIPPTGQAAPPPASMDPCLPFDMPSADVVLNSPKKIFAHYFYPLPLSLDNLPFAKDYYATQYLNPHGENDKFVKQGGMLRARPLPVAPQSGSNWQILNLQQEIRLAIARGINGFAFDIMSAAEAETGGKLRMMLQAAQASDERFKILLMPDMTGLTDTQSVETIVKAVHAHPSLFRWTDGRLVLAPFASERISPAEWSALLARLKKQKIDLAFMPTFGSLQQTFVDQYDDISVGLGNFGNPGTPNQLEWTLQYSAPRVRASKAPILFAGITPQNYRPKDFSYDEAYNSLAYRNAWAGAIQSNADLIQIVTWNDLGESTNILPVTSQYEDTGTGFYNLTGYYATWFLTGKAPAITHDVLYYFYRKSLTSAAAPAQSRPMTMPFPQTPQNQIELLAFLTAPGTIEITIGGKTQTHAAPAGITSFTVPSRPGVPQFRLTRNGASVIRFQGKTQIYGPAGLPTGVLDLTYWSGSASASEICNINLESAPPKKN